MSVAYEVAAIPLLAIVASINPRQEPEKLVAQNFALLDAEHPERSLLHMATSEDVETQRSLVQLVETFENTPEYQEDARADLSNIADYKERGEQQSIVALAASINKSGQLEASAVKPSGDNTYTLFYGQRRLMAIAYATAANAVATADGTELPYPNVQPVLMAVVKDVDDEEAYQMAVRENLDRKQFQPYQEGAIYYSMTNRKNPATGKKWTLKEIAQEYGKEYGHVRNRRALALPYRADKLDADGNVVEKGRGLTPEQLADFQAGKITLTGAIRLSLREEHYGDGTPAETREKPLPLKEMQALFDKTTIPTDPEKAALANARRKAIAECMGKTLSKATKESEVRREEAEAKACRDAEKAAKAANRKNKPQKDVETASTDAVETVATEETELVATTE